MVLSMVLSQDCFDPGFPPRQALRPPPHAVAVAEASPRGECARLCPGPRGCAAAAHATDGGRYESLGDPVKKWWTTPILIHTIHMGVIYEIVLHYIIHHMIYWYIIHHNIYIYIYIIHTWGVSHGGSPWHSFQYSLSFMTTGWVHRTISPLSEMVCDIFQLGSCVWKCFIPLKLALNESKLSWVLPWDVFWVPHVQTTTFFWCQLHNH